MLFEAKLKLEEKGKNVNMNASIQGGREYRNPRICEKLIDAYEIKEYGTNLLPDQFNPKDWISSSKRRNTASEKNERSAAHSKSACARKR